METKEHEEYDETPMLKQSLVEHDLEISQSDSPAKKLAQALSMMETGIRLKRAVLAHTHKQATSQDLDEALIRWLCSDE